MAKHALDREVMTEPDYTCPKINAGMDLLVDAKNSIQSVIDDNLEEIRSANEELREWGNAWRDKAIELASRIEELESELEAAKEIAA